MISEEGSTPLQTCANIDMAFMPKQFLEPTWVAMEPFNVVVTTLGVGHVGLATGDFQDMAGKVFYRNGCSGSTWIGGREVRFWSVSAAL